MLPRCAILILALARVADARRQDVNLVLDSLEGIFSENVSGSEASQNQSGAEGGPPATTIQQGDVAEYSRSDCFNEVIQSINPSEQTSYRFEGKPAAGKKGTYITWMVALENALNKITDNPDKSLDEILTPNPNGNTLPAGTPAKKVKDVGGGVQKILWDSFVLSHTKTSKNKKNNRKNKKLTFTQWLKKRKTKLIKKEMKAILKVDVDAGEFGLLTGGPYAKRKETAAHYNVLCKCTNFLPLYPADETEYTMKAAVPAWSNVFNNNVEGKDICPIVVLMAGSTDLHVGIVSDKVEKFFTVIDYTSRRSKECYEYESDSGERAQKKECAATLARINKIITDVGMTVVGASTEFKLKPAIDRKTKVELPANKQPLHREYLPTHGGDAGNAFVYLEEYVLDELPHAKVEDLHLTGRVFLAARG